MTTSRYPERELLAQFQPHGLDLMQWAEPRQPIPKAADVGAALGMADLPEYKKQFLMLKYSHCTEYFYSVFNAWFLAVVEQSVREKWRTRSRISGDQARTAKPFLRLAMYALLEDLSTCQCEMCEGHGSIQFGESWIPCRACNETGFRYPSGREIAEKLAVDEKTYRTTWRARLQWCRYELMRWDMSAASLYGERLKRGRAPLLEASQ